MTLRTRRNSSATRSRTGALALALLAAALASATAHAARIGHSRVVSGPGQPLQIEVPVLELGAEDARTLQARPAPAQAWQQAGLTPPVPLASMHADIEPGTDPSRRVIRVRADQPLAGQVVDLLLDVSLASGQRQVQVSFLVPAGAPAPVGASVPGRAPRAAATVNVKRGDTLFGIAQRHRYAGTNIYQMLAALYQANPQAFIQQNMNLVRAGETLAVPDAATVRAIDPAEARRLFREHAEAFARYRGRVAGAVPAGAAASAGSTASGRLEQGGNARQSQPSGQDRVRLAAAQGGAGGGAPGAAADQREDERVASGKALREGESRVAEMERNVSDMNRALAGKGGTAGAAASEGASGSGNGTAGAGTNGAGTGGAGTGADGAGTNGAGTNGASTNGKDAAAASQAGSTTGAGGSANGGAAPSAGNDAGQPASGSNVASPAAANGTDVSSGNAAGNDAAAGSPGASSAANGSQEGAGAANGGTPGGSGADSGNSAASGAAGAAAGTGASSTADGTASSADAAAAGQPANSQGWLMDNLLIVVTAILAILAFVIAWLMRRAGARRDDQYDDDLPYDDGGAAGAAFNDKLESIDLDLDDDRVRDAGPSEPGRP